MYGGGKWKKRCRSFTLFYSDFIRPYQLARNKLDKDLNVRPLGKIYLLPEMVLLNVIPFLPVIEPIPFHMCKWELVHHLSFTTYSLLILKIGKLNFMSWQKL